MPFSAVWYYLRLAALAQVSSFSRNLEKIWKLQTCGDACNSVSYEVYTQSLVNSLGLSYGYDLQQKATSRDE